MSSSTEVPDRIVKEVVLRAPRARVWRALVDPAEFGAWFGARITGTVAPGERLTGPITIPGYEHFTFDAIVERVEPERLFSFRWPHVVGDGDDRADELTLVEFTLEDHGEGTLLRVVESGFDQISPSRRALAWRGNEEGWTVQVGRIARWLAGEAP